jgi:hypothetical protein
LARSDVNRDEYRSKIKDAINHHFLDRLGRPEIGQLLGHRTVVFDFLTKHSAGLYFDLILDRIRSQIRDRHGITVDITPDVSRQLRDWCTADLTFGARTVANMVEQAFTRPLVRDLAGMAVMPNGHVLVDTFTESEAQCSALSRRTPTNRSALIGEADPPIVDAVPDRAQQAVDQSPEQLLRMANLDRRHHILAQMREQVTEAEARLALARAAGDAKRIAEAEQALASKRQFLDMVEHAG